MRNRTWLVVAPLALLLLGFVAACGGGGDEQAPPELSSIPTATPPAVLPNVQIVGSVQGGPGANTYVVQEGDLLGEIAAQFGVTVEQLIAANEPLDPTALVVGQVLVIPDPDGNVLGATAVPPGAAPTATQEPDDEPVIYIVQEGDIPNTIAAQFGITADALMAANGITDPTSLNIGDELIIPTPTP